MERILDRQLVKDKFTDFWQKKGFKKEKPFSIIPSKNWTNTLFINSGLIKYIELVKKNKTLIPPLTSCQPCIKIASGKFSLDQMLMRDGYFTFFEQLTCGIEINSISLKLFIENVWEYLTSIIYLPPEKIYVGVHYSQKKLINKWIKAGLLEKNIIFPDNEAFVLNLPTEKIYGIYSPFYFDRGIEHPLSCQKNTCNINCNCGRFLELGDIGSILIQDKKIIDHGIGLERLISIQKGLNRVTEIPEFTVLTSILEKQLEPNNPYLNILADHLRSSIIILSSGLKPNNKKQGYVLRNLIRRTLWFAFGNINPEKEKIYNIYKQALIEMKKLYPYLVITNQILQEIEKETNRYNDLLVRGRKAIKKYLKKEKPFSIIPSKQDLKFFYQTHGIPKELTKTLWKELR